MPLYVLIEFLKKEQVSQSFQFRKQLYRIILMQIKIKKLDDGVLNSSCFPNFIVAKFGFYLSLLPLDLEIKDPII